MLSFLKGRPSIREVLTARHLDESPDPVVNRQQKALAHLPRRRLRELARRARAARSADPGALLVGKLQTIQED